MIVSDPSSAESVRRYALAPSVSLLGTYPAPEGVAAGLARISRDATPISDLVRQAVDDTTMARRRNENIIYAYGHSSIAEGAVFAIAVENIPRALSIDVVAHRLASYTQLSYRYVPVEDAPVQFFMPQEFRTGFLREVFEEAVEHAWATYTQLYNRMTAYLLETGEASTKSAAQRRATEDARYVLPLAQSTQVGMTANARTWGLVMSRLLSHPLSEGRQLGEQLKALLQPIAPSLFPDKYIHALPYPQGGLDALAALAARLVEPEPSPKTTRPGVALLDIDPHGEEKLAAALLFRVTTLDGAARAALAARLSPAERTDLVKAALQDITAHDTVLREFETLDYTLELVHSEACYHQFIRHRMSTQLAQRRTPDLGYTVPPLVEQAGVAQLYHDGMARLEDAYSALGGDERASIILGNGHNRRTLLHLNARALVELSRLRADMHAQWEVRDHTVEIVKQIGAMHPSVAWACGGRDAFKEGLLPVASSNLD